MHWRVLPSPWSIPIPNFATAPRRAISSVAIWPVLRNATDSGPCSAWMARNRATIVAAASSQPTGRRRPSGPRSRGSTARSGASSTRRASHPFGQAMPRLTG